MPENVNKISFSPKWREYEIAVSAFLQALNPSDTVIHDHKEPDRQTNKPRQRDVWIETRIGGLISVCILVSCKDYKRKLNQMNIDHFYGELSSSMADIGVIFSSAGYAEAALAKARQWGIQCCRLYKNQPPDIPSILIFPAAFCSFSMKYIKLLEVTKKPSEMLWKDVFLIENDELKGSKSLADYIEEKFKENSLDAESFAKDGDRLPKDWALDVTAKGDLLDVKVQIGEQWRFYQGKVEAHLLNGVYSISENLFIGNQFTPTIDTQSNHPGEGWDTINRADVAKSRTHLNFILGQSFSRQTMLDRVDEIFGES